MVHCIVRSYRGTDRSERRGVVKFDRGTFSRASKACACDDFCGRADHVSCMCRRTVQTEKPDAGCLLRDGANWLWLFVIAPLRVGIEPFETFAADAQLLIGTR
jgi:hypothetical protein